MEHHIDDHVSAYIDNELPPAERLEIESHLQSCVRCSQLVEELMDLQLQVVASFQTISITNNLEKRVWNHINFRKTIKSWVFTAILSLCILFAVLLFFSTVIIGVSSIFIRVAFKLMYASLHFIGMQPTISMGILLFAILLLVISSFLVRPLLRAAIVEGEKTYV